jgi:hypothetical protein
MMAGGGYGPDSTVAKEPKQTKVGSCQLDLQWYHGRLSQESQLGASLAAEVLRDQRHVALFSWNSSKDGLPRNTEEITASI